MSAKKNLVVTLGTAGLVAGSLWILEPQLQKDKPALDQVQQETTERNVENLSDANDKTKDRYRDEGNDLVNAENARKNAPGEIRPDVKLRLP